MPNAHPHQGQPVLSAGASLKQARAAMILLHGRGSTAAEILSLANELAQPDCAYLAPQAADYTWYPNRFIAPESSNQPWLNSALAIIAGLLQEIEQAGLPAEKVIVLGFSQGACLGLEFVARNPRRYAGVACLSGALIEQGDKPRDYTGSLDNTPILLGCSDIDPHIPKGRVERSAVLLQQLGAAVTLRIYPGMGHTINQEELNLVHSMLATV